MLKNIIERHSQKQRARRQKLKADAAVVEKYQTRIRLTHRMRQAVNIYQQHERDARLQAKRIERCLAGHELQVDDTTFFTDDLAGYEQLVLETN